MPLFILLIPYALFLLMYVSWSFALAYHLYRFSFSSARMWLVVALHVSVSAFLLFVSIGALTAIDWSAPLQLPFLAMTSAINPF